MGLFTYILISVILAAASYFLAPKVKTPDTKAALQTEFDYPTAEEGRAIPVVFGTVKYTGTNSLWTGDYKSKKVEF